MEFEAGMIVRSNAGRDKGYLLLVVKADDVYLSLSDGGLRPLEKPKRKKPKHVKYAGRCESGLYERLAGSDKVTNSEVRRAIALFASRDENRSV